MVEHPPEAHTVYAIAVAVDFDVHSSPFSSFVRITVRLQLHSGLSTRLYERIVSLCAMRRAVKIRLAPFMLSDHETDKAYSTVPVACTGA